jgi:hypothetical protein
MKRFVVALSSLAVSLAAFIPTHLAHAQMFARPQLGSTDSAYAPPATQVRRDSKVAPACYGAPGDCCPGPGGCDDSCCSEGPCDSGCCCPSGCSSCDGGYGYGGGSGSCGSSCGWGNWCNWCNLCGGSCNSRPWIFTADYLYVRANLSEAPAYLVHDESNTPTVTDTFHDLDFQ